MNNTGKRLILISFILALFSSALIFVYLKSLNTPKQSVKKITVLVASETIPGRTLIDKKMIKEIEVSEGTIFNNYIQNSSDIIGKYTKETIIKNEGFQKENLLDKNDDELSLKLDNNQRAVSIFVNGASGVSELLKPKDFVDVLVYLAEKRDGAKVERPDMAKLILQNIEVLAVDKQLEREAKVETDTSKDNSMAGFLITLAVKTGDAEKLVLAENIGNLKLALRPINDNGTSNTKGTICQDLINSSVKSDEKIYNETLIKKNIMSNSKYKYQYYKVKSGDTLKIISNNFYGDESKFPILKDANNIQNENLIRTGEVIKVPMLQK